jgi:hypothetical protein
VEKRAFLTDATGMRGKPLPLKRALPYLLQNGDIIMKAETP